MCYLHGESLSSLLDEILVHEYLRDPQLFPSHNNHFPLGREGQCMAHSTAAGSGKVPIF